MAGVPIALGGRTRRRGAAAGHGHGLRLARPPALRAPRVPIFRETATGGRNNCHTPGANGADSSWSLALIRPPILVSGVLALVASVRRVPSSPCPPWPWPSLPPRPAPLSASSRDPYYKAGEAALARQIAVVPNTGKAKNVILFLGDGMGISTVTAGRIYDGQQGGVDGESNSLAFEKLSYLGALQDLQPRHPGHRQRRRHHGDHDRGEDPQQDHRPDWRGDRREVRDREGS
ncbi:alkaline phosphatase [Caulobacter segnis]